ncbi:MAG: FecR domain-containing protein, partial [Spirochaetota bacterium]
TGDSSLVFARCAVVDGGFVTDLTVEKGGVFSRITKKLEKGDSFNIRTRTAVAAVRGTEFMVEDSENGSNIACVDGKIEVSDAQSPEKSVVLDPKEEVTVQTGSDLVKQQIAADKLRKLQILSNIKEIQKEIKQKYEDQKADMRQKFEQQREEIRQAVVDQKAKDAELVQKQKDEDAARVEAQKATDKANIDAIKGVTDAAAADSVNAAKAAADATKADTTSAKAAADAQKASVKPEIKKTKIDPNQFKAQQ